MTVLIRSAEALDNLKSIHESESEKRRQLRSYYLNNRHIDMLEMLERHTGRNKADVLRTILDEWAELVLIEGNGRK